MNTESKNPPGGDCGSQFPPTAAVEAARGTAVGPAPAAPSVKVVGPSSASTHSRMGDGAAASPEAFSAGAAKSANGNGNGHAQDDKPNPATAAFAALKSSANELKEYVSYYLAAKSDGVKQSIKNLVLYAVLGMLGAVVGVGVLVTASVYLVSGIAHGLATLFNSLWLGELVTALLILGGIGVTAWLMIKKITNNWQSELKKKYEARKAEQKSRFGRNVADRAQERKSPQSSK